MQHDVYAYGVVCPSRLLLLREALPREGQYAEMVSAWDSFGGEAANASIVLAKLGIRVKLDGNWIEDNVSGRDILRGLKQRGIDVAGIKRKRFSGPEEFVISTKNDRTIFGKYRALAAGQPKWNAPLLSAIRASRVVMIDPFFGKASTAAARAAKECRVPYSTVDDDYSSWIIQNAAVSVISREFRHERYPERADAPLFDRYLDRCRGLVVFTSGSGPIRYGRKSAGARLFKPPVLKAVDTSGAGDSFRAGMVYGLLQQWPDADCIRFSSAIAAINCMRFPGVLQSPTLVEIRSFMQRDRIR